MASENNDDAGASGFISEWGGAVLVLIVLVVMVVVASTGSLQGSGLSSSGEKAMYINIVSIGGWNVWWFIVFGLLSMNVVVYHLRQISKSLRSQQKEQG